MTDEEVEDAIDKMTSAVRAIAHGGTSGPSGLEMVAMALAGDGMGQPIGASISEAGLAIAEALREIAVALREVAEAAQMKKVEP